MQASAEAGIRHYEFGGGARYQAPYFYLGEDPFEDMKKMREAVGPDVDFTRFALAAILTDHSKVPYDRISDEIPIVFDARGIYRRLDLDRDNVYSL